MAGNGVNASHDRLSQGKLLLSQPPDGYRFSVDALILAHFAGVQRRVATIADLGTGCGIVGLLLARRYPDAQVTAIENNVELSSCASLNANQNNLSERFRLIDSDILHFRNFSPPSAFELVVSNPPFRAAHTGKTSPRSGRDTARHESTARLHDFLLAAKYLVKPGGRICFIQHPTRLKEFVVTSQELKLALLRLRMVHGTPGGQGTMFLAELAKGSKGGMLIDPPLILRDSNGAYTPEAAEIIDV